MPVNYEFNPSDSEICLDKKIKDSIEKLGFAKTWDEQRPLCEQIDGLYRKLAEEKRKRFYRNLKKQIKESDSRNVNCDCGGHYIVRDIKRHYHTMSHQKYLQSIGKGLLVFPN